MLGQSTLLSSFTNLTSPLRLTENTSTNLDELINALVDQNLFPRNVVAIHIGTVNHLQSAHAGSLKGAHCETILIIVDVQRCRGGRHNAVRLRAVNIAACGHTGILELLSAQNVVGVTRPSTTVSTHRQTGCDQRLQGLLTVGILTLPSTGVHSNGFSLVRKVFNIDADPDVLFSTPAELGGKTLGEALLAPTKIYVKPVLKVLEEVQVKGISHITGGGFYENIPRSLKKGCCARINKADVRTPALFHLMQKVGGISEHDMFNTFNMGVGMVLTVPAEQADKALEILHANGEPEAYRLGVIAEGEGVELC